MVNRLLFKFMLLLFLFVSCKSNNKEESLNPEDLENILQKAALKTDDDTIKEVLIVFYEGKKGAAFQPKDNFMFRIEKDNPYFKYNNFSEEGLLKGIKDSVLAAKEDMDKLNNFFRHENTLLKDVYGDTIGKKPVWKIYFMNKSGSIFKFMDINGEPQDQNIIGLKSSCSFLLEKIKNDSQEKNKGKKTFFLNELIPLMWLKKKQAI